MFYENSEENADRSRHANVQRWRPHHRKQGLHVWRMWKGLRKSNPSKHHLRRTNPRILRMPKMHDKDHANAKTENHPRIRASDDDCPSKKDNNRWEGNQSRMRTPFWILEETRKRQTVPRRMPNMPQNGRLFDELKDCNPHGELVKK